jgi:orotate phosphoribosyltransferase
VQTDEVLDHFRQTGAMLEGHFELSSGLHSDRYFQCALVLSQPRRAGALALAFAERFNLEVDVVVGPAMGAVVWAQEVGRALDRRAMFTERVGGVMTLRRGFRFEQGERCLVVEDVLTTGGSAREALEVVRAHGGLPVGVGSMINRSGGNPFEDEPLPLTCLAEVEVQVWEPAECPLCAAGGTAVKPGSRTALAGGGP